MIKVWGFLFGVVNFSVKDYDISRLNRLRKFCLFNIKCKDDTVNFSVRLKYFKTVKRTLNGFEYTANENYNLCRMGRYLTERMILCVAIAVCCLIYFLSGYFIYDVRVVGGEQELNASVADYLHRNGVKKYVLKMKIKSSEIANNVVFNFANVAHTNVRLVGTTLLVTILSAEVNNDIAKKQISDYIVSID